MRRAPLVYEKAQAAISASPIAILGTDGLDPRIAIALPRDPELGRGNGFRQMQQLGVATEVQKNTYLSSFGFLSHLEDQPTVSRMAAHDGDKDDPL